ncbi:MAG: prolyl oligopeptidase family serine peptidase, partial [Candidatus Delongbacteria bacterium]
RRSLSVFDIGSKEIRDLKFNEECYTVSPGSNPMFESNKYRYVYESLTTPYSIEEYDIKSGETKVLKKQKVLNDFDLSGLRSELIYARASDGEEIPVSVVYMSKKFKKDGTNPLLLEGYGAYGDFNDPYFSVSRLSLLERGFIYAIAHVRGGLEKGKKWHYDGMLLNKKNTFTDFISCSEHLISEGYTSKDKLVILGESAGGMLIGAVLNMRSDLYRSAVLDVPFLDVLNTMLDPGLSATVTEYDEWGNPTEKKYFEYISSYCPYQNIQEQEYPNVLVIAGLNDPRVSYWEPLKWAAKIRDLNTGDNEVILLLNSSGHSGSSGRYDHYRETAKKYSYILNSVGYKN